MKKLTKNNGSQVNMKLTKLTFALNKNLENRNFKKLKSVISEAIQESMKAIQKRKSHSQESMNVINQNKVSFLIKT